MAITAQSFGQCSYFLEGTIKDVDSQEPIESVLVSIVDTDKATYSLENGYFKISNVCPGQHYISYAHIGCEDHFTTVEIHSDTTITVELKHGEHQFDEVSIISEAAHKHKEQVLSKKVISDNATKGFSEILENISGVSLIKTGANVSKPIVEGLTGNRVTLLNNGIAQSGQQWGVGHSPEIDPLIADNIRIIKGAKALQHPQSNHGEVVLVETEPIQKKPRLNGKVSSFFETNGRLTANNVKLSKYHKTFGWRVTGTYKKGGDRRAPGYYLTNTGTREMNFSADFRKDFSDKFKMDVYASNFSTDIAILRGAHVSTRDQVLEATTRDVPFFTKNDFSYDINPPRQKVNHRLGKVKLKYFHNDQTWTDIVASLQNNSRREYDVRRGGRSNTPALNINQYSFFLSGKFNKEWEQSYIKAGTTFNFIDNTNVSGTGILPLIPDHRSYESSLFGIYGRDFDNLEWNIGGRLDYVGAQVLYISRGVKKEIIEYNPSYLTTSLSTDFTYKWSGFNTSLNLAYNNRPPAINEAYSSGLHQGVSGLEFGDPDLKTEHGLKTSLGFITTGHDLVELEMVAFYERFKNYIYLQPLKTPRTTIRGTHYIFEYMQDDADIIGVNLKSKFRILNTLKLSVSADYLRGQNTGRDIPLVYMPANSIGCGLHYNKKLDHKINKISADINFKHTFKQTHFDLLYDLTDTPDAFNMLSANLALNTDIFNQDVRWTLKVENALNTKYRLNTNRLRYFADEMGRNIILGLQVSL